MTSTDPTIVKHHINMLPNATPIPQKQRPMHPAKAMAIKSKIDKLWKAEFIFPIEYTSWVSNPIPITKKYGTIYICMDFRILNHACPKDNFPTDFIK